MLKHRDFSGGVSAINRMFHMLMLKVISRRKLKHKFRFFNDGVGYVDQQQTIDGVFEKGLIQHIISSARRANKTKLYVDIGANIGNHAVAVAHNFDVVAAYEPHPVLFRILEANLLENGFSVDHTYNFGLGKSNVNATLVQSLSNHGLSKVKEFSTMSAEFFSLNSDDFNREFPIEIKKSYDELNKYKDLLDNAFIKIDVEGMEADILESILPLLKHYNPIIALEWAPREQPDLKSLIISMKNYVPYGCFIRQSKYAFLRHVKNLFFGRQYCFEKIDFNNLENLYPLVFLIPSKIK